ncbi:hypothetical protein HMPREF3045_01100 [Anaerococcus sp. HMSC075B03]|uniref:hypothetical protein n=1 Tax=Anaerococcus sp. HMSC075B03 TaxID=1739537 RepID=UPI0008A11619|nr:hypothetical protein [Anaerococcus sp. HMSC075B03]OFO41642.1 hypothetical protein HMPREF3045_01100 [Anaerococcus sp. HMSC075B03]
MKLNKEKKIDYIFRFLSIISIIVSVISVKYANDANKIAKEANDTNKDIAIAQIESQKSEAKLDSLQNNVISLESIRSKIDVIEEKKDLSSKDYSREDYEKDIENLDLIYNSIRTNINKKNKFASKLEEKFNSEIKLLRSEINSIDFNIHSKYNGGLRKKVQSFVNAGSMPDLEELFSKYEEEENKLILNKLQK